jgi:diguanylate cyclase (GGDEF)-like protein
VSAAAAFGLVLVDLDELKALNDTQGHAAGDATLSRLATVLAGAIRRDDVAARVGGDEFAVLVDGAGTIEAALAVERLDAALTTAGLSASVGWAAYPEDGDSAAAVRERADRRLYEQKARRRARGEDPSAAAGPKAAAEPLV